MNSRIWSSIALVALLILTSVMPQVQATDTDPILDDYIEDELTWVDCWMGHKSGNMSAEMQVDCDTHFTNSPSSRLYGIRWIFLNVSESDIPDDWIETQLANLNHVFGQWDFQFQTDETVVVPNAVAESDDYYDEWTLEEIMPDLRTQLNLSADNQAALDELKSEMADRHVSQEELDNLTLDSTYSTGGAFRLASRARSESITVVIRPNLDSSGMSGGPSPEFQHSRGGAVELNSNLLVSGSLTTLPHEVGHYFGISHSHAPDFDEAEADFGFEQRWGRLAHDGVAIKRVVGDDWSQPFGEPWVSYDEDAQKLVEFQELMGEAFLWPIWQFLYKGDHQNFDSLADFIQYGESGEIVYRKNFLRNYQFENNEAVEWYGNNCVWNSIAGEAQCRYNEPMEIYTADHPSINNSIFFENGTVSNLMSYITPPYDNFSTRKGITDTQLDMIRFTANTPFRLLLRNHCFDNNSDACSEEPDLECTPGDTQPAEDGCNNCVCTENGIWVCTEIGCPDDEVDRTPRISLWPGKVNQHNENGTWMTDPDGISGGHPNSEYPNDYGGLEVEYCQKFWPTTTQVVLQDHRENITFYTEGNKVAYNTTKDVWICQTEDGGIPEFDPVDPDIDLDPDIDDIGDVFDDLDTDSEDDSEEDSEDDEQTGVRIPGFGMAATLSMLGLVALFRSRRNYV